MWKHGSAPFGDPNDIYSTTNLPNADALVAYHQKQIVGMLVFTFNKDILHILSVDVLPDKRRKGVGSEMIRAFHTMAKKVLQPRGAKVMRIEIGEGNVIGKSFLEGNAFHHVDSKAGAHDDGDLLVLMRKID